MENLDETLEANKENLSVTAFTSGAITNGAIKKGTILLEKTENSRTKFYTSSQLTPDQKRELLFNVDQPFEVSMCEFDEEWWPLVSNIWTRYNYKNHTNGNFWKTFACRFTKHNPSSMRKEGIPDEKRRKTKIRPANLCFMKIKVSRFITEKKVYIERYQDSSDHTHTIKESKKLKHSQFVRNLVEQEAIKNYPPPAIVNAIKEYAIEKLNLSSSVKELRRKEVTNIKSKVYKLQNTYLTDNINLELDIEESVVFFKNQEYQYDWRLFTLYIRDNHSCWDVGAHFFVSKEDSDTVAEALKIIRRFVCSWKPRYFLSDQSNVEANGIAIAFPGLLKGEQNCEIIFCTVHVMQTWMTKIYETKAIDECQAPTVKQYILRNYIKNTNQWALWAHCIEGSHGQQRQHSPLLLQITSTNAIESYHSELKRTTVSHHGLIGT
ncbi:hypothetical protein Glove_86g96 [Diversispora epigaea]|uniref:MULE transposase domain-containing protein n=1 Tax=Diversispora epigaea TaxID=1348612 RepID=A0A397J7E5_9GLOM|nr:hypothetical protein Glove_86g96 [Diversispora epigaea]